jgi:hypothetical protein
MPATGTHQQSPSHAALAAIAEAQTLIGNPGEKVEQFAELKTAKNETHYISDGRTPKPVRRSSRKMLLPRSLVGLLALIGIGVAVFAWRASHREVASDLISTSSVSVKKKDELPTPPAPHKSDSAAATNTGTSDPAVQDTPQDPRTAPIAVPLALELARRIQMTADQLDNLEQAIGQLKTLQSQMASENAELIEQLRATREMAHRNVDLTEELKAAQAQMARDNGDLADQLKANQGLLASIADQLKESQEQLARLVTSGQNQRPRPLASSPPTVTNSMHRPVSTPPPPPARAQTQNPKQLQPKQQ